MASPTGATPLFALEALALDLETTGLDATKAMIVQIGAIPISNGMLLSGQAYERLVNPGAPIPAISTRVHGITDEMVQGAPALPDVWQDVTQRVERRVVIGHTVGFDLTVLAADAARRNLPWRKPRALCVRMLATVAAPSLASHSLDALAGWLELDTRDRHRALGDAEAAGLIFLALVPRLRDRGIRTLAEAERACRSLSTEMERHVGAGWEPPVSDSGDDMLGSVDTYAYRHRVGDVMASPPVVVSPETTLRSAVDTMVSRAISSVFVTPSGQSGLAPAEYAILTERDALRRIAAEGAAALELPVEGAGSRPVQTIRANAFLYRAVGRMSRLGFRHLGVRSEDGALIGVVSTRDLLKLRAGPAIALDDAIENAASAQDMAIAWSTLPAVVRSLVGEEVDARVISQIVSEEIRSMTRRAAVLAGEAMEADGLGGPPCPFAVLVLGSGGRGESLLVPDQDNALVFATGDPDGPEDAWFAELGARMADILDAAGIPYCNGGVMAKNPEWRGSLPTWTQRIDRWVRLSRPQDLLNVDIFFDAMPVHGHLALGHEVFGLAYSRAKENAAFVKLMGEQVGTKSNPLSFFGGLKGRDGRFDMKIHILFPVVSAARTLAIGHGVAERSTRARIEALVARGIGSEADLVAMLDAQALGMSLLLAQQSRDIAAGERASSSIEIDALSRVQLSALKRAVQRLQNVPTMLRDSMFERPRSPDRG